MKKIMLSLAALLTLGLTSCVGDFEDTPVTYPAEGLAETGVWQNGYLAGDYDYTAVRTKTADGDDLFYIVREGRPTGKDSGSVKMLFVSNDGTEYNSEIGMYTAYSDVTFYGDGANGTDSLQGSAYLAYQNNMQDYTLQLQTSDAARQFTCTTQKTDDISAVPIPSGYWEGHGANGEYLLMLLDPEESIAIIGSEDADAEYVEVTAEGGVITVKGTDSGKEVTFAYNKAFQLEATLDGSTFVVDPLRASDSQPEVFIPVKVGTFTTEFFNGSDGGPYSYNAYLLQSERNTNRYVILPYIDNDQGMLVEVTSEQNEAGAYILEVEPTATGYEHPSYGMIWAQDAVDYGIGENGRSNFDGKLFTLNLAYYVSAGYFGEFQDTFKITGDYEEPEAPRYVLNNSVARTNVLNPAKGGKKGMLQHITVVKQ